ncbi:hypothetical protein C4D60_Mb04t37550 [Musa balbisiana]|uniref:Uncharacterized protein n=1 Tax=Musa balbisiana TaxID=52838 RepID=A0A4S8KHQ4_MUSBA|nr:hypothetical protein C4D60_Mb04t37550 [Musa balbisiana]
MENVTMEWKSHQLPAYKYHCCLRIKVQQTLRRQQPRKRMARCVRLFLFLLLVSLVVVAAPALAARNLAHNLPPKGLMNQLRTSKCLQISARRGVTMDNRDVAVPDTKYLSHQLPAYKYHCCLRIKVQQTLRRQQPRKRMARCVRLFLFLLLVSLVVVAAPALAARNLAHNLPPKDAMNQTSHNPNAYRYPPECGGYYGYRRRRCP